MEQMNKSKIEKSPDAFRTISEAASEIEVPQHVLRFWETKFKQIKPLKRGGGRRYYRPEDLSLLKGIRTLLYGEGYTIRGVQKVLREQGQKQVMELGKGNGPAMAPAALAASPQDAPPPSSPVAAAPAAPSPAPSPPGGLSGADRQALEAVLGDLRAIREMRQKGGNGG